MTTPATTAERYLSTSRGTWLPEGLMVVVEVLLESKSEGGAAAVVLVVVVVMLDAVEAPSWL